MSKTAKKSKKETITAYTTDNIQSNSDKETSPKEKNAFFKSTKKKDEKNSAAMKNLDTTFVLKEINYANLDRSYGMKDIQDFIFKNTKTESVNTTKILQSNNVNSGGGAGTNNINKSELKSITTKLENLGFSDKVKEPFETIVRGNVKSNIYSTFKNKKDLLSNCVNYKCWYCRNNMFPDCLPLALPIKYYPSFTECSLLHNSIINTVSKLAYTINTDISISAIKDKDKIFYEKVNLTSNDKNIYNSVEGESNKNLVNNEYFEGEGIFCSFNCMVAYAAENSCIKYKNAGMLINKLYKAIFGIFPKEKIVPSPSWKLLKEYGGDMSLDEYRRNFQTVDFACCWQYNKNLPNGPVSELFLENKIEKDIYFNKKDSSKI